MNTKVLPKGADGPRGHTASLKQESAGVAGAPVAVPTAPTASYHFRWRTGLGAGAKKAPRKR